jgi:AcrR family transcriptional regulator
VTRATGQAPATRSGARARHEYPPTAAKLLAAARRVLVRKGYAGLTMQAIEEECGVNRALVHYYFGSKAGLLEALFDTLFEDPAFGYSDTVMKAPAGAPRAAALLEWLGRITADRRSARMLYELLPHVLRSHTLRRRAAELYAAYRGLDGECLASGAQSDEAFRQDLGALSVAVVEGLGIQAAVDPHHFERDRAYALWQQVITFYLDHRSAQDDEQRLGEKPFDGAGDGPPSDEEVGS